MEITWESVFKVLSIALMLSCAVIWFCVPETSAALLVYGSMPNYSAVVLPNNSYVEQGQNISQGNWHDLRGIYGFSGTIAHWNTDSNSGQGQPDVVIDLIHPEQFYIDPAKMPIGRWWQWDGMTCDIKGVCTTGFGHGNAYVFAVVKSEYSLENATKPSEQETIIKSANITMYSEGEAIDIPVTVEITVTPEPEATSNQTEVHVIEIPTPISTEPELQITHDIEVVTPRTPISIFIPLFALLIGGFILWYRK